jgi:hypothetical protein
MKIKQYCEICKSNKFLDNIVKRKKIGKRFYSTCPTCDDEINLTTQCMAISTDSLVKRLPNIYQKVSTIAVRQIV